MSANRTRFYQLNHGWNADPNMPIPWADPDCDDLVLGFHLNSFIYETFELWDKGHIRFHSCPRYRFSDVNDEGWYRGQCRFSKIAPNWDEFYEVKGDFMEDEVHAVWNFQASSLGPQRNFIFYLGDSAFECSAHDWSFDQRDGNSLKKLPSNN